MIPTFAVVGRTNKGKSSIVATLTENDQVAIAKTPRTTRRCQTFELRIDREPLLAIVDTPGFEEAAAVLEWLRQVPVAASERPARVRAFLAAFADRDEFPFEKELLKPILAGATIIYVADGSKPYRPNFEDELEVLRWTGQPSLALINMVGEEDHSDEWRRALDQYFKIVRVFDAHSSHVPERIQLLRDLSALNETLRRDFTRIAAQLEKQHRERLVAAARIIAELINDVISYRVSVPLTSAILTPKEEEALVGRYLDEVRALEQGARRRLARVFDYHDLKAMERELERPLLNQDLFSSEVWQVFGLSRLQVITGGLVSGAVVGGALDAAVGGASFLVGTALGSIVGSGGAAYLSFREASVLGMKVSGQQRVVGPHANPNFPWIVLDRALLFTRTLLRRTHARRDEMQVEEGGYVKNLSPQEVRKLAKLFQRAKRDDMGKALEAPIMELVERCDQAEAQSTTVER